MHDRSDIDLLYVHILLAITSKLSAISVKSLYAISYYTGINYLNLLPSLALALRINSKLAE